MNPYQQGQYNMGYPNVPQCYGNPTPVAGFSTMGYPQVPMGGPPQVPMGGPPQVPMGGPPQVPMGGPPQVPMGGPVQGQMGYPCPTGFPQQAYPQMMNQNQSVGAHGLQQMPMLKPTVTPAQPFSPQEDAAILRNAMKILGTDEKAIIRVLARRTNAQRQQIAIDFKTLFGRDLVADLKSETSGRFRDVLVALMTPLPEYYAKELYDAVAGLGTDEGVLIEIMCSVSNNDIQAIKKAYAAKYGNLDADLRGDTSGHFKRLLTSLCMGNRSEENFVNEANARQDAQALVNSGVGRIGTDESVFNQILCYRSFSQLQAIFKEYKTIANHDIEKAIQKEFSGDIKKGLMTIVKVVRDRPLYFAERLHKSMKGLGTKDLQLIRVMVTRSEIDLGIISDTFERTYKGSLQSWIEDDCSGYYKKCLLALLGHY